MKEFAKEIAEQFVDHPDEVTVSELCGKHTVILELRCNSKDIGRVIGRNGRTISAIRTLLNAVAARYRRRAILEVVE